MVQYDEKPRRLPVKVRVTENGKPVLTNGKAWFKNQPYNFDSAAGIDYTVDVSKPEGKRVSIKSFSDGRPFEMNRPIRLQLILTGETVAVAILQKVLALAKMNYQSRL